MADFVRTLAPPARSGRSAAGLALPAAAGAVSGALLAAAFPSLGWDWLAWFALVPLFALTARAATTARALLGGYVSGIVFFALSCPWIAPTVHNYGGLSDPVAGLVFVLFLLLMGAYFALFAAAGHWLGRRLGHRLLPLPFLWVAVELFRTYTPMGGFPWNLLGYSQYRHAGFMLIVPLGGVYAASLLIALANTALAAIWLAWRESRAPALEPVRARPRSRAVVIAAAIGLALILAFATLPWDPPDNGPLPLRARLVQPNAPLNAAWSEASLEAFLRQQLALSLPPAGVPTQLIVWPEQPAPLDYASEPAFQRMTASLLGATRSAFLFGEVSYPRLAGGAPDQDHPRNSVLLVHADGTTGQRYDKLHLVPFGEYDPLPAWIARLAGVGKLVQDVSDFVPGRRLVLFQLQPPDAPAVPFATMICYESIFPAIARDEVAQGAQFLVNQSDDSWYGRSSAAAQGLMMARVRAMENRRWLLRDTNDGLTAVVDPYGRIAASLPRFRAAAFEAAFAPRTELTFYTRHGDWPAWACAVIIGLLALVAGALPRHAD